MMLLRESGALGDLLQVGSVAAPLKASGHDVEFWTFPDDTMVEFLSLVPGFDRVHKLQLTMSQQRPRGNRHYDWWPYLSPLLAEAEADEGCILVDLFCPGCTVERETVRRGGIPDLSRAQAFCAEVGIDARDVRPAKLLPRDPSCWSNWDGFGSLLASRPVVVCLEARSVSRSLLGPLAARVVEALAEAFNPLVAVDILGRTRAPDCRAVRFPGDFTDARPGRATLHALIELISCARLVVTVDSFPLHAAGSCGTPAVVLCGPTHFQPATAHYSNMYPIPLEDIECSPCYFQESRGYCLTCESESEGCMAMGYRPASVVAAVQKALDRERDIVSNRYGLKGAHNGPKESKESAGCLPSGKGQDEEAQGQA